MANPQDQGGFYEQCKAALEQRKQELIARLQQIDEGIHQERSQNLEDQASEIETDEVMDQIGEVSDLELRRVESALNRLDAGTYGVCSVCNEPIAKKRLTALPMTEYCIECSPD